MLAAPRGIGNLGLGANPGTVAVNVWCRGVGGPVPVRLPKAPEAVRAEGLLARAGHGKTERGGSRVKRRVVDLDQHHDNLRAVDTAQIRAATGIPAKIGIAQRLCSSYLRVAAIDGVR